MDDSEFDRSLKLGLGRAILYLQEHPAAPHRDAILDACLHNWAYDAQIEGNRAEYMFDIIELTDEKDYYREQILAALADSGDEADAIQLFDLARLFAQQGDVEARQAIYDKFVSNCSKGDCTDATAIIQLDGIAGFLFAADEIGGILLNTENDWVYGYLYREVEERCGKAKTRRAVKRASAENVQVKAYMDCVAEVRAKQEKCAEADLDHATISYAQLKQLIINHNGYPPGMSLVLWGKQASETELAQAAADLLLETNPKRLRAYVRIFRRRCFPLDIEPLIGLARNSKIKNAALAMRALENIIHPKVRAFALELVAKPSGEVGWVPDLLINNFQEGDHLILESLLAKSLKKGDYHRLGLGVLDFCEAHPNPESEERLMLALYEYDPCAFCRSFAVDRLFELDRLPAWMAEECRYDANLDTREKFRTLG